VGGIGVSKIEARGEVFGLQRLDDFAGAYAQARYGFALGTTSAGELWLQNRKGVVMHLKAKREGLILSLGECSRDRNEPMTSSTAKEGIKNSANSELRSLCRLAKAGNIVRSPCRVLRGGLRGPTPFADVEFLTFHS
jgi:hypothetical protein